jgi:hypothetical protein
LVWAHANRLFAIFKAAGAPMNWLRDIFKTKRPTYPTRDI